MKGTIIKEIIAAAGTIGFVVILTISFGVLPALGNFLNPFGIWTVPNNAEYHDMTIKDACLNGTVTVYFDEYGVPHIFATTDHDLFFALGYLHASNRFFEMDIFRRVPAGRMAELLGESWINTDKYFRILGFHRAAQEVVEYMRDNQTDMYNLLQAYADGVNKYISTLSPVKIPLEYKLLGTMPEPWSPFDTIVFKYLQSWDLSGNLADLDFTLLQEKLPPAVFKELYPNYTLGMEPFQEPIIQEYTTLQEENVLVSTIKAIKALEETRIHILGDLRADLGSNNWAVNGSKSVSGNPLLAGDPHLGFQQPSLWYEVHMVSDEGYNCTGVTFPAAPVILIGHNDHIAWSLTNVGGDSHVDFYEEMLNGTHYYFNGSWHPLKTYEEVIQVKGGPSVTFTVRETIHGPLITDHDLVVNLTKKGFPACNISLKWTGTNVDLNGNFSNEMVALYKMNKATNFAEFNKGLRYFGAMQNVVYADDSGTIAMTVTGPFPIRKQGVTGVANGRLKGNVIQNGTGVGEEWAGFIPFNELPREINPSRCWVSSANQPSINGSYPYYIGENTFDRGYRARRINSLLQSKAKFTIDDFKTFQLDIYDFSASQFLPILLDVWNYSVNVQGKTYDPLVADAMNELFKWNQSDQRYLFNKSWIAPTIYDQWIRTFEQDTWDEFSAWGASGLRLPPVGILENLTKFQPDSRWFDDNSTAGTIEGRNYTMLKSFNETVAYLQANYGSIENWVWGNHHQIYVEHLMGMEALSSPRIPIDGRSGTLNNQWETGGPSMRLVIDLGDASTSDRSYLIYPGGENSNPVSSHYWDLFYLYVANQYHNVYRSTIPIVEATWTFVKG
ncbi:MAG: penicillin acylase family protein [Candidatus Helarchaeota archaeon]